MMNRGLLHFPGSRLPPPAVVQWEGERMRCRERLERGSNMAREEVSFASK